jgi:hypothetical protein
MSLAEVREKGERMYNRSKQFTHVSFVPGRFVFAGARNR